MEPEGTDSYFFGGEGDEAMKNETIEFTWTESASVEVQDGEWRKVEATLTRGGMVEDGVSPTKAENALKKAVKRSVKDEIQTELDAVMELREDIRNGHEALENFEPASEAFAKEVGAEVAHTPEEKPPLPGDETRAAMAKEFTEVEVVRTPLAEGQATFRVRWFEVAETANGDKYLKCFGKGSWKREWVPAWKEIAEMLFDNIDEMDLGEISPPYDLEATVEMGEYKNPKSGKTSPSPQKVVEWTRVG